MVKTTENPIHHQYLDVPYDLLNDSNLKSTFPIWSTITKGKWVAQNPDKDILDVLPQELIFHKNATYEMKYYNDCKFSGTFALVDTEIIDNITFLIPKRDCDPGGYNDAVASSREIKIQSGKINLDGLQYSLYQSDDEIIQSNILSPRKQMMNGVLPENVVCKEGLQLIFKSRDNSPACVKPQTVQKLVARNWGSMSMQTIQKTWVAMAPNQCDNPWENDLNDWYVSHNYKLTTADRLKVIKNYYQKLGITIFDLKIINYAREGIVTCAACDCVSFSTLFVSVSTSDLHQMLELGFKISENQSP